MISIPSFADSPKERFWRRLSQEFSFTSRGDAAMEQQLRAVTETWMICTSELFDLPIQITDTRSHHSSGETSCSDA